MHGKIEMKTSAFQLPSFSPLLYRGFPNTSCLRIDIIVVPELLSSRKIFFQNSCINLSVDLTYKNV